MARVGSAIQEVISADQVISSSPSNRPHTQRSELGHSARPGRKPTVARRSLRPTPPTISLSPTRSALGPLMPGLPRSRERQGNGGHEQPAQATAVTTVLQSVDGTGAALHGQPAVPPRGPSRSTTRHGFLPPVADPSGDPQLLQNRVDRARLQSASAHDLQPRQLGVGAIGQCPQHRQTTHHEINST
jgi:hypothetical protein